jgi:hypothetical protein
MTTPKKKSLSRANVGDRKTVEVDPGWLEEIPGPAAPLKVDSKAPTRANDKSGPGVTPPRMMSTMEVDVTWLESGRTEPPPAGASAKGGSGRRKVAPPPLPPPAPVAKAKRKAPPPLPREDPEDAAPKPMPRRSTRPPKR